MSAYIQNDLTKCVGCGLCQGSCASGAIALRDGKAVIDPDRCVLCRVCLDTCPVGALTLESDAQAERTADSRGIWVFAEMDNDGQPLEVDVDHWSNGDLSALDDRIAALRQQLEQADGLSLRPGRNPTGGRTGCPRDTGGV